MGLPSYLHKKNDIYYFRQACPKALKSGSSGFSVGKNITKLI